MFKQTTVAFLFDILALIAGFLIAYQLDVIKLSHWALALYPALISIRIINGLLSGRLSTALHLGTINPRVLGNTKTFHSLVRAIIVLTLVTSVTVSAISLLFGYTFWGITTTDFPAIITVMVSTLAIGLLYSIITIKVAFMSFKRGLDPDIVVYPIISIGAIIFITLCYIAMLRIFFLFIVSRQIHNCSHLHCASNSCVVYTSKSSAKPEPEFLRTLR